VNATAHLGRLLVAVEEADSRLGVGTPHPVVGRGTLTATVARGGDAPFTLAARAEALIERRTIPGETGELALDEVGSILAELRHRDPAVDGSCELATARSPWELADDTAAGELLALLSMSLADAGGGAPTPDRGSLLDGVGTLGGVRDPHGRVRSSRRGTARPRRMG
jgi:acetylornithine deacetylase